MRSEQRASSIEFMHSKIHPDGNDPPCPGRLTRTTHTRMGYVSEVREPLPCTEKASYIDGRKGENHYRRATDLKGVS
jgi:hypothetical protein